MSLWKGGSSSVTLKGTQRCGRVGGFPEARAEPGRAAGPGAGGRSASPYMKTANSASRRPTSAATFFPITARALKADVAAPREGGAGRGRSGGGAEAGRERPPAPETATDGSEGSPQLSVPRPPARAPDVAYLTEARAFRPGDHADSSFPDPSPLKHTAYCGKTCRAPAGPCGPRRRGGRAGSFGPALVPSRLGWPLAH